MTTRTLWQVGGALLVLAILAAGWFLGIAPIAAAQASDEAELLAVEQQNSLIVADIRAMSEVDRDALEAEVRERTRQLPPEFDEAQIYREIETIVTNAGGELARVAITPPVPFAGVPSAAVLPEGLAPAVSEEELTAAAAAGLVVATATIEFGTDEISGALDVIGGLAQAPRIYLVSAGALAAAASQTITVELYFLPDEPQPVAPPQESAPDAPLPVAP